MNSKKKDKKETKSIRGSSGTYGVAPLGYIEVAGSREALQKAAKEITSLKKEIRSMRREIKKVLENSRPTTSRIDWDYSSLEDMEQIVIKAFLRGDFKKNSVKKVCQRLSSKYGKKEKDYRRIYQKLMNYGTLHLISCQQEKE